MGFNFDKSIIEQLPHIELIKVDNYFLTIPPRQWAFSTFTASHNATNLNFTKQLYHDSLSSLARNKELPNSLRSFAANKQATLDTKSSKATATTTLQIDNSIHQVNNIHGNKNTVNNRFPSTSSISEGSTPPSSSQQPQQQQQQHRENLSPQSRETLKRKPSDLADDIGTPSHIDDSDNYSPGLFNSDLTYYPSSDLEHSTEEEKQEKRHIWHLDYVELDPFIKLDLRATASSMSSVSSKSKEFQRVCDLANAGELSPKDLNGCLVYSSLFPSTVVDFARFPPSAVLPSIIQNDISRLKDAIETRSLFIPSSSIEGTVPDLDCLKLSHILMNIYFFYHYLPLRPPTLKQAKSEASLVSEMTFIATSLTGLLTPLFSDRIFIKWDSTSLIYKNDNMKDQVKTRSDLLFCARLDSNTRIEIGNGEVKAPGRCIGQMDCDRVKVMLLAKRQLHVNLLRSKNDQGLVSFGMVVAGDTIQLYIIYFDQEEPFYTYYLYAIIKIPFVDDHYLLLDNTLKKLLGWKDLMNKALDNISCNQAHPMLEKYKNRLSPTISRSETLSSTQFDLLDT